MTLFRFLLVLMLVTIVGYTSVVIANHGLGLIQVFFGDMAVMAWPGQFNLDFMFMLTLSGLWVAWKHRYGASGIALGLLALFGGSLFLSIYLLVESFRTGGDARAMLLGSRANDRG
ncbi:MAG: hypothetical protein U1F09_10165 [Steroidobacteraceae bacterium]